MEEKKYLIKSKKQMFLVIGVFALVMLLGTVTYAFFNYTRTGARNTISTGSIYFNSEQTGSISVSNFFPTDSNDATHGENSSQMTVTITAGTSYEYGITYSLTAVNVTRPSGSTTNVPVRVVATVDSANDIGFTPAAAHVITNTENFSLGTGQIDPTNSQGVDNDGGLPANRVTGVITVTAYIDASEVAITDTPAESSPWQGTRTVVDTTTWNRLAETPVTFQVRVVADEGSAPASEPAPAVPTMAEMCPGCQFIYSIDYDSLYYYTDQNGDEAPVSTLDDFESNGVSLLVDDYRELNSNIFLGFKFDDNKNVTNAYVCGIKRTDYLNDEEQNPGVNDGTAFCIEGATDGSKYTSNSTFLNDSTGIWQGRCSVTGSYVDCSGSVHGGANSSGGVYIGYGDGDCYVSNDGKAYCTEY